MKEKRALGFYNYTVILTYLGMLISFVGISCAIEGRIRDAMICLMLSGICDMFDGSVAATRERNQQEKRFGIQIDSLSDLICFGVFPGILVYIINEKSYFSFFAASFYVLCALIRLAYFNVMEEERQSCEKGARKYYTGLPVTTAALFIPAVYVLGQRNAQVSAVSHVILLFLMATAFILPVKIKKPYIIGKIGILFAGVAEFLLLAAGIGLEV